MTEGIIQKVFNDVTKKTCGLEYSILKYVERELIAEIKIHEKEVETPYVSGLISVTWLIGE